MWQPVGGSTMDTSGIDHEVEENEMRSVKTFTFVFTSLLALLVFAACSSEATEPTDVPATSPPAATATSAPAPTATTDSRQEVAHQEDGSEAHEDDADAHAHSHAEASVDPNAAITHVLASDFEYMPARLEVAAGEPFSVMLHNIGTLEHDITIEGLEDMGGIHIQPTEDGTATFTVDAPGEYTLYCTILGHRDAGMVGELLVTGSDGHAHTHDAEVVEPAVQETHGAEAGAASYAVSLDPVGHWHVLDSKTLRFTVTDAESGNPVDADNVTVLISRAGSERVSERSLADERVVAEGGGVYTLEYNAANYAPHAFSLRVEEHGNVFTSAAWVVELSKAGEEGIRLDANGTTYVYQIRHHWEPGHAHASDTEPVKLVFEIMRGVQEGDGINWEQPWRNTFDHVTDAAHPEVIISTEDGSVSEELHPVYKGRGIYETERVFTADEVGHGKEYEVQFKFTDPYNGGSVQNSEHFHLEVVAPH